MAETRGVGEGRKVGQGQGLVGEQRAGQQGERRILGTGDGDTALESLAAANDDLIHRLSLADARGRASGLAMSATAAAGGRSDHGKGRAGAVRSEEHTSELQSLMRISYAVFCLKKKNQTANEIS